MTITSNVLVGLPAWASSHAYAVIGTRVGNGGNCYQLIGTGVSAASGGPVGTGANITDNTCAWKFVVTINFTSTASFAASLPTTLTQPVICQFWSTGNSITTSAGIPFLSINGHVTSSTNTITFTCAPGESLRDALTNQQTSLAFGPTNGVSFTLPGTAGNITYVNISDNNVILDGLQFQDPLSTSNSTIIGGIGNSVAIHNCIFDGYAQTNNSIIQFSNSVQITNSLIIDRQASNGTGNAISLASSGSGTGAIVNCTLNNVNNNTSGVAVSTVTGSSVTIRNTAIFGYSNLTGNAGCSFDHCCLSTGNVSSGTNNGNNLFSKTLLNQFISGSDFRLQSLSECINTGITDTINIPTADDIARTVRPQSTAWDIGTWEYKPSFLFVGFISLFPLAARASAIAISANPIAIIADSGFNLGADPVIIAPPSNITITSITNTAISLSWAGITPTTNPVTSVVQTSQTTSSISISWTPAVLGNSGYSGIQLLIDNSSINSPQGRASVLSLSLSGILTQSYASSTSIINLFLLRVSSSVNPITYASSINTIRLITSTQSNTTGYTFAETNFTPVTNVISTGQGNSTITLSWNVPSQYSSFFIVSSNSTATSNLVIHSNNCYVESLQAVVVIGRNNLAHTIGINPFSPDFSSSFGGTVAPQAFRFSASGGLSFSITVGVASVIGILSITPIINLRQTQPCSSATSINISSQALLKSFGLIAGVSILPLSSRASIFIFGASVSVTFCSIVTIAAVLGTTTFIGRSTVESIALSASLINTNGVVINSSIIITTTASAYQNYFFTAAVTFPVQFFGNLTQSGQANLIKTIEVFTGSAQVVQNNKASSTVAGMGISCLAIISNTCSGTSFAFEIDISGTLNYFYNITAVIQFSALSVYKPPPLFIQTENGVNITLDGRRSVVALTTDLLQQSIIQSNPLQGAFSLDIRAVGTAQRIYSLTVVVVVSCSVTAFAYQTDYCFGSTYIPPWTLLGRVGIEVSALVPIMPLICGPTQNYIITADPFMLFLESDPPSLNTFITMDSLHPPQMIQQNPVSTTGFFAPSISGTAFSGNVASIKSNINPITLLGQINQYNISIVNQPFNVDFTSRVQAVQQNVATTVSSIIVEFAGISFSHWFASGVANIDLGSNLAANQTIISTATLNLNLPAVTATAAVGYSTYVSGRIMPLSTTQTEIKQRQSASGVAVIAELGTTTSLHLRGMIQAVITFTPQATAIIQQQDSATAIVSTLPISALITSELGLANTAALTILPINAAATAVINGSSFVSVIGFNTPISSVFLGQADAVYCDVSIGISGGGNAWITPTGFVNSEFLVWWSS